MRFLTVEGDGVPLDTFGSEDNAERESEALEHWTLFDMEFEIRGRVGPLFLGVRKAHEVIAATADGIFEADSIFIGAAAIGFN